MPEDVERWVADALAGDEASWVKLLGHLWDQVESHVNNSRMMGQLRGSIDDRREVVSRVFARLRRNDFRALRTYDAWLARNRDKTFGDWLAILTANQIRDYVTERIGSWKRLINTLAESLEDNDDPSGRPPITNEIAATELLAHARAHLAEDQLVALTHWLAGHDFAEIAALAGLAGEGVARARVRAALARLRREVRED
jgi:hypothetical protein